MSLISLRDGSRIFVEVFGSGPPLLLVHGFTGSGEAWGAELKGALAARMRVLCVDLLGHGQSDKPEQPERYTLDAVVEDLCAVLDAHELECATWAGYSMGGRIALGAAVRQPNRVRALILEGASPGLAHANERRLRVAQDEQLARVLESEGIVPFVDHWMKLPLFDTQQRLDPEYLAQERARRLRNAPGALAACLRGLGTGAQPSLWAELGRVRASTLLIVGEQDSKFRALAARMTRALPRSRIHTVPGAGHATHLEYPPLYARAVLEFCKRTSAHRGEESHEGPMDARA